MYYNGKNRHKKFFKKKKRVGFKKKNEEIWKQASLTAHNKHYERHFLWSLGFRHIFLSICSRKTIRTIQKVNVNELFNCLGSPGLSMSSYLGIEANLFNNNNIELLPPQSSCSSLRIATLLKSRGQHLRASLLFFPSKISSVP